MVSQVQAGLDRALARALLDGQQPPYDMPDSGPPSPVFTGPPESPEASPAAASTPQVAPPLCILSCQVDYSPGTVVTKVYGARIGRVTQGRSNEWYYVGEAVTRGHEPHIKYAACEAMAD